MLPIRNEKEGLDFLVIIAEETHSVASLLCYIYFKIRF